MAVQMLGHSFDAGTELGIGRANRKPLPSAGPGEIIIRIDSLTCEVVMRGMYDKLILDFAQPTNGWQETVVPSGVYKLRLPIPESNNKNEEERSKLLRKKEKAIPAALAVLGLICLKRKGIDPLCGGAVRCLENTKEGMVEVKWATEERLKISLYPYNDRCPTVWGGAALKLSD